MLKNCLLTDLYKFMFDSIQDLNCLKLSKDILLFHCMPVRLFALHCPSIIYSLFIVFQNFINTIIESEYLVWFMDTHYSFNMLNRTFIMDINNFMLGYL